MSQVQLGMMAVRRSLFSSKLKGWLKRGRHRLYEYRPRFRDRRFWVVQGLAILIIVMHNIFESEGVIDDLGVLYFLPLSLLLVPVVYAALNFGLAGALATSLWAMIITIPNFVFQHQGVERVFEIFQLLIVNTVAFFVGQQVDRQRGAWQRAEAAATALTASETKYRGLFESSPIAILVLDTNGGVLDANPAAGVLFGKTPDTLKGMVVVDLVGTENEHKLRTSQKGNWPEASFVLSLSDSSEAYLEPTHTPVSDSQGNITIQVLLRDVTHERHRQAGLKAYAAYVLRAQEDTRQRIARELHDETIQTLVLLCRRLDAVEGTSKDLPSSTIKELRNARATAEEVVKELRDFTKALRPPILDDLGIVTAIRRILLDCTARMGIKGQLNLAGKEQRLRRDVEVGMFRIAQEALWNMERHSRATEVVMTMTFSEGEAILSVSDNGVGFKAPGALEGFSTNGRLGLMGIQERAELLGGKLELQSASEKGTTVTVTIPILKGIYEVPNRHPVL